jgi:hypothetical protein
VDGLVPWQEKARTRPIPWCPYQECYGDATAAGGEAPLEHAVTLPSVTAKVLHYGDSGDTGDGPPLLAHGSSPGTGA